MTIKTRFIATFGILIIAAAGSLVAATIGFANPGVEDKKIEDITKLVAPSVVKIEARNGMRKVATGVVIDKEGFIITTALVSPRDEEISVITSDGRRIAAEFKGLDTQTQIGLVQVKEKGLTPIAMGKSGDLKPGSWIGVVSLSPENTAAVTQGIVSSVAADKLRLNVWVVPGMSGSPVINGSGQMVGLLRGAYTDQQPVVFEFREQQIVGSGTVISRAEASSSGMALAIPLDIVTSVASDLEKKGKVERGWLGVRVGERDGKLEVAAIEPKSPAELAKIKEGDIILKIDGKDIASGEALSSEVRSRRPGQDVTIRIERDGKPMDVKAKLGEYTEEEAQRELTLSFPNLFPPQNIAPPRNPRFKDLPRTRVPDRFALESRKFVGVKLRPLSKEMSSYFGVKDGIGFLVEEIVADGPAKKAGLKIGDVILKADGKRLDAVTDLSEMIQNRKKGDKVRIEFIRDKKPMTLDVEVGEEERGPEDLFRSFPNFSLDMTDLMMGNDSSNQNPMDEFFQRNQETIKRITDEMEKRAKPRNDKFERIIDILSNSLESERI